MSFARFVKYRKLINLIVGIEHNNKKSTSYLVKLNTNINIISSLVKKKICKILCMLLKNDYQPSKEKNSSRFFYMFRLFKYCLRKKLSII